MRIPYGYVHISESSADNVWAPTFIDSTGLDNAYAVTGGVDTDGNGRPELFVSGDSQEVPGQRRTFVYEAVGDNCFTRVATLPFYDAHRGGLRSCVVNLDAIGREEFVLRVDPQLLIYKSVAPGQWSIALTVPDTDVDGTHGRVLPFDANRNGRPELFWIETGHAAFGNTLVLEHTAVSPTQLPFDIPTAGERLSIFPNPCRTRATLILAGRSRTTASTIATFDASGRLVARFAVPAGVDRLPWSPVTVPPGIYFLRLEAATGAPLAHGRVTVIR